MSVKHVLSLVEGHVLSLVEGRVRQAMRRCGPIGLIAALGCLPVAAGASEGGAQDVVREFCQADGFGNRVSIQGWSRIAPLVAWPLEPSWDSVVLITSYTIAWPQLAEDNTRTVEVRYGVSNDISASGIQRADRVDTVAFRVQPSDTGGWRILGPPPPPHIFEHRSDPEAMRRSLERGGVYFLPNSLFVWHMFRSAGWDVAYQRTADLLSSVAFREVKKPAVGDVVVYLRDGAPYHVGLLEAEAQVVSSTLNGGIMRTTIDTFAGDVKFLRLVEPEPSPSTAVTTPTRARVAAVTPTPRPKPTQKAAAKKAAAGHGRTVKPTVRRHAAQPSQARRDSRKRRSPTPVPRPAALD